MLTPAVSHSSHKPGDDYDEARFVHHLSGLYWMNASSFIMPPLEGRGPS